MSVKVRLLVYGFLLLLFLGVFVFRIESSFIGPRSHDAVDDLAIQGAWIDSASNTLYMVGRDRWARLDLTKVQRQNTAFAQKVFARGDNFLHWKSFQDGRPQINLSGLERVAILTDTRASFNYMRGQADTWRVPSLDFERPAAPPSGFGRALFSSDAEGSREYAQPWFKSYLLTSPEQGPDGRYGVQFFFHPDYRYSLGYADPFLLILLGPSFVALLIALPRNFENARKTVPFKLYVVSGSLHTLSFIFYLFKVFFNQAWGIQLQTQYPGVLFLAGYVVLACLLLMRKQREAGARPVQEPPQ